ncbi:MAG: RNA-binding S4 domain-containing protein [Oxalobacteraceae bacterium]|nr:RNA-binding S4 domain-containing protein [Oxalobacteraceae bacterium]
MSDNVRIDKFLWAARFFKTRSLATDAVAEGRVRLNGARTKPAHAIKVGDTFTANNGATEWEAVVLALSEVRGSTVQAQALYSETEASIARRQNAAEQHKYFREPSVAIKGRPTKRDRRLLDKSGT